MVFFTSCSRFNLSLSVCAWTFRQTKRFYKNNATRFRFEQLSIQVRFVSLNLFYCLDKLKFFRRKYNSKIDYKQRNFHRLSFFPSWFNEVLRNRIISFQVERRFNFIRSSFLIMRRITQLYLCIYVRFGFFSAAFANNALELSVNLLPTYELQQRASLSTYREVCLTRNKDYGVH